MKNGDVLKGIDILRKYVDVDGYDLCASHDQVYFCNSSIVNDSDDVVQLLELGWFIDEEAWCFFT